MKKYFDAHFFFAWGKIFWKVHSYLFLQFVRVKAAHKSHVLSGLILKRREKYCITTFIGQRMFSSWKFNAFHKQQYFVIISVHSARHFWLSSQTSGFLGLERPDNQKDHAFNFSYCWEIFTIKLWSGPIPHLHKLFKIYSRGRVWDHRSSSVRISQW